MSSLLRCGGCNTEVDGTRNPVFQCPQKTDDSEADHVLSWKAPPSTQTSPDLDELNPYVKYRSLMYPHHVALARGMTDTQYVDLVRELDEALVNVGGVGFRETPLLWHESLNSFIKIEAHNVGQSHKARHLFNVVLYLSVLQQTGVDLSAQRLAVASCGNAGLAAATIAAAAKWPIDVCIPPDADPLVVSKLSDLGADVQICDRDGTPIQTVMGPVSTKGSGDPCVTAFRNLVSEKGSIPFSVQGPECWLAVEGGQMLPWEAAAAIQRDYPHVHELGNIFIQVGGGALGAGFAQGMRKLAQGDLDALIPESSQTWGSLPALNCIQPEGNAPLVRAFSELQHTGCDAATAAKSRSDFMTPWPNPHSIAHGILDDETYEWVALCDAMASTKGSAKTVREDSIQHAKDFVERELGLTVCHTGAAGLAGLFETNEHPKSSTAPNLVVLSGLDRAAASRA